MFGQIWVDYKLFVANSPAAGALFSTNKAIPEKNNMSYLIKYMCLSDLGRYVIYDI